MLPHPVANKGTIHNTISRIDANAGHGGPKVRENQSMDRCGFKSLDSIHRDAFLTLSKPEPAYQMANLATIFLRISHNNQ